MDGDKHKKYRELLLKQKGVLQQVDEASQDAEKPVQLDQSSTGRLTRMDAMQAQEMALASRRRRKQQLLDIEKALIRIHQDDYGYCLECGEAIPGNRLEYNPAVEYCLLCAEKIEKTKL